MAARARGALGAHRAARLGDSVTALAGFTNAVDLFSEMGTRFARAVVVLEQAEWLASEGRTEEARACAADARATFERLKAMPWLERVDRLERGVPEAVLDVPA